jgi:hypothetical protein
VHDAVDHLKLSELPNLRQLFETLNRGNHINRHHDHALWADLEKNAATYEALLRALGYDLQVDVRGFAWLQPVEATTTTSQTSRRLALFFLILLEYQADQGLHLGKFQSWVIDLPLLERLLEKNRPLLETEGMGSMNGLVDAIRPGVRYGVIKEIGHGWSLLPAAYRYLDHFEALANATREQDEADATLISNEEDML